MVLEPSVFTQLKWLLASALGVCAMTTSAPAQPTRLILQNVVRIEAVDDNTPSKGYGMIVGRSGDLLWVATAAHVVFKPGWETEDDPEPLPSLSAQWIGISGRRRVVRAVMAGRNDVAFIAVDAPAADPASNAWAQRILNPAPTAGESVAIAATVQEIDLDPDRGRVPTGFSTTDPSGVPGLAGEVGQSGAPVTSDRGVIGLFTAHAGADAGFVIRSQQFKLPCQRE